MKYSIYAEAPPETMIIPPNRMVYQTIRRVWFPSYEAAEAFVAERTHKHWVITWATKDLEI